MSKIQLRETILKGNKERMIELAGMYGLSLPDFLYMLANVDWYCINRDIIVQRKLEGKKIPKELEYLDIPRIIQLEKYNTERLTEYIEPETYNKLKIKARLYGIKTVGLLFDKICCETLQIMNPDLINGIKLKQGGKNGI